jgi:hypothetical protein
MHFWRTSSSLTMLIEFRVSIVCKYYFKPPPAERLRGPPLEARYTRHSRHCRATACELEIVLAHLPPLS